MDPYIVKILKTEFVTHNVKHFVTEKPHGINYTSGQAADISINLPGFENELRPFTFTSVNEAEVLEFIIKIYTGHNGVTEKLAELNAGDELIIHDVFGTIQYKGPGLFIAGGAGITPFISIFRQLSADDNLNGNTLLFANRTEDDIILKSELAEMLGKNFVNVIEKGASGGARYIDKELLQKYIGSPAAYYYICGPDKFTSTMVGYISELGISKSQIIIEE